MKAVSSREAFRASRTSLFLLFVPHWLFASVFLLLVLDCVDSHAQPSQEYQLKAVFVFRLTQFVEWPTNRFESPDSPIIIGVLGRNPFGNSLTRAVQGETAHDRRLVVRQLQRAEEARECHVVFIARSEASRARQTTSTLSGAPVLTVSDIEDFATASEGMVELRTDKNKVNLLINPDKAKSAGLVLHSRLLRMAQLVKANE